MKTVSLPYGRDFLTYSVLDSRFKGELVSRIHNYKAVKSQEELLRDALEHPIETPVLRAMAEGKKKVTFVTSDHTRPVHRLILNFNQAVVALLPICIIIVLLLDMNNHSIVILTLYQYTTGCSCKNLLRIGKLETQNGWR